MREKDERLKNLKDGNYRVWHDAQNILIPKGQSTTKPTEKELVNANTKVFGTIQKSYFNRPKVEFTATLKDEKVFDWYYLETFRKGEDITNLPPNIDLNFDVGLTKIMLDLNIVFSTSDNVDTYEGFYRNQIDLKLVDNNNWISNIHKFSKFSNKKITGDFTAVCNPKPYQTDQGFLLQSTYFVQNVNLRLDFILNNVVLKNGNSEMELLTKNNLYVVSIKSIDCRIIGGE